MVAWADPEIRLFIPVTLSIYGLEYELSTKVFFLGTYFKKL